ncbi:hypothetical protein AOZ06_01395 [Kibdelosporangium phytohabitans]|uniref:Uncharacterized protein n=1 Tax=Kibdelosporangium phytohabitans TaxID=860235 RepID=A0A0N9HRS9_9PSEU|nr:hypothetical protein AOZ06_01395 [Kibdelosporangium phytohabitans]
MPATGGVAGEVAGGADDAGGGDGGTWLGGRCGVVVPAGDGAGGTAMGVPGSVVPHATRKATAAANAKQARRGEDVTPRD